MIICGIFHVYKSKKKGIYQYADGHIIRNINKKDKLIIVKSIDMKYHIENCDEKGCLNISSDMEFENVHIDSIFSYGEYWESLNGGMSARLKSLCNLIIEEDDVIYKVISTD